MARCSPSPRTCSKRSPGAPTPRSPASRQQLQGCVGGAAVAPQPALAWLIQSPPPQPAVEQQQQAGRPISPAAIGSSYAAVPEPAADWPQPAQPQTQPSMQQSQTSRLVELLASERHLVGALCPHRQAPPPALVNGEPDSPDSNAGGTAPGPAEHCGPSIATGPRGFSPPPRGLASPRSTSSMVVSRLLSEPESNKSAPRSVPQKATAHAQTTEAVQQLAPQEQGQVASVQGQQQGVLGLGAHSPISPRPLASNETTLPSAGNTASAAAYGPTSGIMLGEAEGTPFQQVRQTWRQRSTASPPKRWPSDGSAATQGHEPLLPEGRAPR